MRIVDTTSQISSYFASVLDTLSCLGNFENFTSPQICKYYYNTNIFFKRGVYFSQRSNIFISPQESMHMQLWNENHKLTFRGVAPLGSFLPVTAGSQEIENQSSQNNKSPLLIDLWGPHNQSKHDSSTCECWRACYIYITKKKYVKTCLCVHLND